MNKELVFEMLSEGYNCSQTVLSYFSERYGLDKNIAKKIAKPFESGMFQKSNCGAVSGAYMVLGLEFSRDDEGNREEILLKVKEFNEKFIKKMESKNCFDLLGIDVSIKENLQEAMERGLIERVCPNAILSSIEILEEMI